MPRFPCTALLAAALLAIHAGLIAWAARTHFVVIDEVGFLASGVTHWQTDQYFAYRVNPPLPRMLAALPMLAAGAKVDYARFNDGPTYRCEIPIGQDFAAANREQYLDLVFRARLVGIGWSVLGGLAVFLWAREQGGNPGGLLALTLWAFNPMVIALAALVEPDNPAAVAGLIATYAFWHYLRRPSWMAAWIAGLLLGMAQLTKFTLLVLYPTWVVVGVVAWWAGGEGSGGLWGRGARWLLIVSSSVVVINVGYGFAGTGRQLGDFVFISKVFRGEEKTKDGTGNRFHGTAIGSFPVPLPTEYLRGIDTQRKDFESGWHSYLRGEWRDQGWWYYYLYGLGVKLPLGMLGLIACGAFVTLAHVRNRSSIPALLSVWLPPVAIIALVSSQTGFNHHVRYVLPAIPFLCVGAGASLQGCCRPGWTGRITTLFASGCALWAAVVCVSVAPHFLAYFNEAAGGPERGHEHLADSNIDWGQDLLYLKRWVDQHPREGPLYLAYFNTLDAAFVGIQYELPPADPRPGQFAVSVHFVVGGSFMTYDGHGRVVWIPFHRYSYFLHFQPVARAGDSIFIYEISSAEAERVRALMGLAPLPIPKGPGD